MIAAILVEESRDAIPPAPWISDKHKIHPVILVPILAPMIILMPCITFIIPEFTKPTTITEVAEEDWMIAVTPAPSKIPFTGLLVSL